MSNTETPEDVYTDEDMALVGRSLMESLRINCPDWSPAQDPAEIVTDLLNEVHDLKRAFLHLVKKGANGRWCTSQNAGTDATKFIGVLLD